MLVQKSIFQNNINSVRVYNHMSSDDKYIHLAINALIYLREKTNVDDELKEFTHIVIKLIEDMNDWEDVKEYEECCNLILLAFEELEKNNFDNCSHMLVGHYRSMMGEIRRWNRDRIKTERI